MQNQCSKKEIYEDAHRFNIYEGIHKAVRAFLCDTLGRVATLDIEDEQAIIHTNRQLRELLVFCIDHIAHEDRFVHPAMERRQPGSSGDTANDHLHHARTMASLMAAGDVLECGTMDEKQLAWRRLHRELAVFVGESLLHMDLEESANNQVLQACYSDEELFALHQEILAALTPKEMALATRWMMMGCSPAERAQAMAGMRADAPPPAFEAMLDVVRASLAPGDWQKLAVALALPPVAIAA